jgi:hypothetical protein
MNDIESLTAYAREDLDLPPKYHGTEAVRCRFKSRVVLWRGVEWHVTADGDLEKRNGEFRIRASDLWHGEAGIGWIQAMSALDDQTDLQDFCEGLRLARGIACGKLDRAALRPNFAAAG